jgi:hypothetical protein
MPPSDRFVGGATLHKELQGFVSFIAYQKTCLRNGTAMSQLMQQEALGNEYFGNPDDDDSVGLCEQLLQGVGLFAHLFEREDKIQTDAHGMNITSRNPNQASTLVLKTHLHLMSNTKVVVGDSPRDINRTLLYSSTLSAFSNTIKAKALILRAQEHIKNCKKALSVIANPRSPYSPYIKTGNLPSGMTLSDYYMYVRKKMFVLLGCADAKIKKVAMKKGTGPVVPALLAGSVNAIADVLQMKASRTTDVSNDLHPVAPEEEDGASATSGSFKSCNPNSTASNDAGQCSIGSARSAEPPLEVQLHGDGVGDSMPQDWTFPGFISFVLLGPIVPPCLLPYRSEIMMPSLPTTEPGNTANGRAALRKEKASLKSRVGVAATPPKSKAVTLQQKLMIAGIAQSQIQMEKREQNREQDRMIAFYQKKVAAQRMLIEQIRYTISVTPAEAPNRHELLERLNLLNTALANAVTECLNAEEEMLNKNAAAKDQKVVAAKSFIDLTIATVLGATEEEEDDDCEIIGVTHQKKKDSVANASASSILSTKKRKANPSGSTPLSSNKMRKVHRPVGGWTMTSPIARLKDDVSPLSCEDEDSE